MPPTRPPTGRHRPNSATPQYRHQACPERSRRDLNLDGPSPPGPKPGVSPNSTMAAYLPICQRAARVRGLEPRSSVLETDVLPIELHSLVARRVVLSQGPLRAAPRDVARILPPTVSLASAWPVVLRTGGRIPHLASAFLGAGFDLEVSPILAVEPSLRSPYLCLSAPPRCPYPQALSGG